ncbi:hypothetical protein PTI45_02048 [Paenibacillus nuruki]|uniref:Uncharacterized protein n=1 Tax=Paenibacillus nuruki TaxID=1886670 RepID=A0A1E3L4C7_9BACL|nr:hypothetical protein [Paenibacillus nuruki]ODP28503.1 hypothetical protein PTI45_02048 [Paenibacillus nuruki]
MLNLLSICLNAAYDAVTKTLSSKGDYLKVAKELNEEYTFRNKKSL